MEIAETLSFPTLNRVWQMLLKGLQEIQQAPVPFQAFQMVLLRVVHASTLPSPEEIIKHVQENPDAASSSNVVAFPKEPQVAAKPKLLASFEELVMYLSTHREPLLTAFLKRDAHLVSYEPGKLVIRLVDGAPKDAVGKLMTALKTLTNQTWVVETVTEGGQSTLFEQEEEAHKALYQRAQEDPLVKDTLALFPGTKIDSIDPIVQTKEG